MQNWIHSFVRVFFLSALGERRRGGEFINFKVGIVETLGALPLCSLWSYLCSMMSSDKRVFGKVKAQHPHTDHHTAVHSNWLSSLRLKVLSVFAGPKPGSHRCLQLFIHPLGFLFTLPRLSWLSPAYAHVSPRPAAGLAWEVWRIERRTFHFVALSCLRFYERRMHRMSRPSQL